MHRLFYLALMMSVPLAAAAQVTTVSVEGNVENSDEDIRIACGITDGVTYDTFDLLAIEECLMLTGVFETATVSQTGDTLVVRVRERVEKTTSLSVGLAVTSMEGVLGELTYVNDEVIAGTSLLASVSANQRHSEVLLSLYRDEVFGETGLGFDILGVRSASGEMRPYSEFSYRLESYAVFGAPSDQFEAGLGVRRYGYDLDTGAYGGVFDQELSETAPYARLRYRFERRAAETGRDQPSDIDPSVFSGGVTQYIWNIGSGHELSETNLELAYGTGLGSGYRFQSSFDVGAVFALGDSEPGLVDRFFNSADDVRGFAGRGIGPVIGDAIGGTYILSGSLDVEKNLGQLRNTPIFVGGFFDYGSVWGGGALNTQFLEDDFRLRSSVGLTLSMDFDMARLSLYLADPISSEKTDETQRFGIALSSSY